MSKPIPLWQQILAVVLCVGGLIAYDARHWLELPPPDRTWQTFLFAYTSGPYVLWLVGLPAVLLAERVLNSGLRTRSFGYLDGSLVCFAICFAIAVLATAGFGWNVRNLPHAYHDEYSYLFQARTFLAGRLCLPAPPLPHCFDQMHVLTEGVYASRYFPGTGLWLAPFVAAGVPILGWWLLNGLIAGFCALIGRDFSPITGYLAGVTVATAPGMIALGNLLLSPSPTMLGMVVFLWSFPRAVSNSTWRWPLLAGLAIGYAFLCRPLTAVGLGFPFALYSVYRLWHRPPRGYARRWIVLVASFALSPLLLMGYNLSLTGRVLTSPYGLYTARHTPCHVYGFYNRDRGLTQRGPSVHLAYDEWSENLTPRRAAQLVNQRWWGLMLWSVGLIPVGVFGLLALSSLARADDRLLLLLLSLTGLTLAYAPYGFPGLLGWGYLFEAMPPLLLVLAIVAGQLFSDWHSCHRPLLGCWWLGLPTLALAMSLCSTAPSLFAPGSELAYPRYRAARRQELEAEAVQSGPVLVVVDADPRDSLHASLVYNRPTLDGPVVRVWDRGQDTERLLPYFIDRNVYICRYDHQGNLVTWLRVRRARDARQPQVQ